MNLFSILEESARKWPGDPAVVHDGRTFRYSELYDAAESLAGKLRETGVEAGDKVGVTCPNSPEYLVAYFAVLRAQAIVVPMVPELRPPEIARIAKEMALDAFCHSSRFNALVPEGDQSRAMQAPGLAGGEPFEIRLAAERATPESEREQLRNIDAATIGFSSGTTSRAKGIIRSHATFLERVDMQRTKDVITKSSSILWLRPLNRTLPHRLPACMVEGAKVVLANSLATDSLAQLVREQGVNQIYAGALFFRQLLEQGLTREDLRGVSHFISGGTSLPRSVAEVFHQRFGCEIGQSYGLAECTPVLVNMGEDPGKRGSVGKPLPGREIKLARLGSDLPEESDAGEILVRGPGMFDAYYKPWRLREEVLENGWFRTGDLAREDADGYYWIVGRVKDVINVGGTKVFPSEIEEALLTHPAVEEAVVYGVAEGRFGEVPHAKVKLRGGARCTERELMRHVNDRVSVFKSLRGVEFVEEIPKTVTGKSRRTVHEI